MTKKSWTEESKQAMIEKQLATKKKRGYNSIKFTFEQAEQMRHLGLNKLMKHDDIMKMFNISKATFYKILNGEIYSQSNPTHLKCLQNFGEDDINQE